jgi:hypothetical protein
MFACVLPARRRASTWILWVNSAAISIGNQPNSNRQCGQDEGGTLSPRELEGKYKAALSRIVGAQTSGNAKRHTPIFQREPVMSEKQAIRDAANALAAIWKIGEPSKR